MRILNLGAGVQSTTVYLMAHAGEIQAVVPLQAAVAVRELLRRSGIVIQGVQP